MRWWRIGLSGSLSGLAICGMHYLGNASINNYRCSYQTAYVVAAALIAVAASTAALALFFVFQAAWTNAWWRRTGCAMVLAGAVSGMHWCAAAGTRYTLLHLYSPRNGMSRDATIIVVICLVSILHQVRLRSLRLVSPSEHLLLWPLVGSTLPGSEGAMPVKHSRSSSLRLCSISEEEYWSAKKGCYQVRW